MRGQLEFVLLLYYIDVEKQIATNNISAYHVRTIDSNKNLFVTNISGVFPVNDALYSFPS